MISALVLLQLLFGKNLLDDEPRCFIGGYSSDKFESLTGIRMHVTDKDVGSTDTYTYTSYDSNLSDDKYSLILIPAKCAGIYDNCPDYCQQTIDNVIVEKKDKSNGLIWDISANSYPSELNLIAAVKHSVELSVGLKPDGKKVKYTFISLEENVMRFPIIFHFDYLTPVITNISPLDGSFDIELQDYNNNVDTESTITNVFWAKDSCETKVADIPCNKHCNTPVQFKASLLCVESINSWNNQSQVHSVYDSNGLKNFPPIKTGPNMPMTCDKGYDRCLIKLVDYMAIYERAFSGELSIHCLSGEGEGMSSQVGGVIIYHEPDSFVLNTARYFSGKTCKKAMFEGGGYGGQVLAIEQLNGSYSLVDSNTVVEVTVGNISGTPKQLIVWVASELNIYQIPTLTGESSSCNYSSSSCVVTIRQPGKGEEMYAKVGDDEDKVWLLVKN